ncbi:hypothetical protein Syun_018446 [Stephania yunnanensis]|uniref:Uncharacterized protein n=1 Tax=Stephania yunnanensis TaxID=152371 RepID=A0AAP0ISD8_9MAGN
MARRAGTAVGMMSGGIVPTVGDGWTAAPARRNSSSSSGGVDGGTPQRQTAVGSSGEGRKKRESSGDCAEGRGR